MEELGGEGREGKKGRGRGGGAIQCLASGRHRRSCATGSEYVLTPQNFTFFHSKLLLDSSASFTCVTNRNKTNFKTNFLRRLQAVRNRDC